MQSVAVRFEGLNIAREQRGDAELKLEKPTGMLNGVMLELYVRCGSKTQQLPLGAFPDHLLDVRTFGISATDMQMDDKVFVQASITAHQPAALQGDINFKATLTIQPAIAGGQPTVSTLEVTLSMQLGKLSDLVQCVWWVKP